MRAARVRRNRRRVWTAIDIQKPAWPSSYTGLGKRLKLGAGSREFHNPVAVTAGSLWLTGVAGARAQVSTLPPETQYLSHAGLSWLLQNRLNAGSVGVSCLRSL